MGQIYNRPLWCDPPAGHLYGFPKIYDCEKYPNFYKWLVDEGYPKKEIDKHEGQFYCRWWEVEGENA